ncbi:MAG TPA: 2-oxoglutarate dehydrogenase complex dihydrolipoyllysine-residue succinyltransferase [Spirochaetia bacterium]|nr:2-oxoglutarate dehydrogenase complex dihydrolipoyllysine-residue succinyltransferase [Spirochaetia bacterium]
MSVQITVPQAGESVSTGVLAAWLKEDGAAVNEGEELFELETDKATLAVPAPASGTLKHSVAEGTEVAVGSVVGEIMTDGASAKAPAAGVQSAAAAAPPAASVEASKNGSQEGSTLSPAARRVAEENHLSESVLHGTGKGGLVTKEDALRAAELSRERQVQTAAPQAAAPQPAKAAAKATPAPAKAAPTAARPVAAGERRQERVAMTMIRRRIAEHLVQGKQEAAYLTTFNEIDMSHVMALRTQYRDQFESRHGIKLGFMSFFVKASCQALAEYPEINAYLEGSDIVYNRYYDIGVAVSSERGLVVPVVRDAEALSFAEVEQKIADLAGRVREKRITVDELSGGTFTITNGGIFGSLLSTPIPNFPQSAILGMHSIQKRPIAVDDQVVVRPMMYVALSYDHRIVDGHGAVSFLVRIKQLVENPERLLLEV